MASSYSLVDLPPLPAIDNPKALQIRGAESAPGNGYGVVSQAGRLGFGATAGNIGFGSTENLGFGSSAEKSEFGAAENLGVGTSADKLGGYGGVGGAGGKLRSSRREKKTPYDRPAIGRHATPGGSAAMAAASMASTITSRLRESASRLISSSASYLFSAVFKRRVPAIKANGESHTAEGIAVKEDQEEETLEAPANQDDQNDECADQAPALDVTLKPAETEKRELDIGEVEEVLKRRTWTREQVNRLTGILQAHLCENAAASPSLDAGRPPQEQPKKNTEGSTPVQVAQAYMGEQATRPPGVATSIRSPAYQSAEVQPSLGGRLLEDRYMSSPFSRTWAQSSVAVRMPKRSFVLDDDLASMGPIRRVRQKTSMLTSTISYPYSRQMTGSSVPSRTLASPPPTQSSQTALRILETLEKMSPSKGKLLEAATKKSPSDLRPLEKFSPPLKGKSLDESKVVAGISSIEQTPETSKAREKRVIQNPGLVVMPKSPEPNATGKPAFGGPASLESEAMRNSINESPALIPGSPIIIPERTRGFRMSAVFEESNSDEESKPHTKLSTSSETRHPTTLLNVKEATSLKPCVAPMAPVFSPTVDVSVSTTNSLPMPVQSSVSHAPESNSLPVTFSPPDLCEPSTVSPVSAVSEKPTSNFTSFPTFSFPSAAMATGAPLSNAPASPPTVAAAVSLEKTATSASPSILAAPEKVPEQAIASTPSAAASESAIAAASSSPAVITAVPALFGDISTIAPGALLAPVSTPSKTIATHEDLSEAENGVSMVTESPVADKLTEVETMATDSVAEEADSFFVAQSAPAFQSGLTHIASPASTFSFGASAMSSPSSAFSFAAGAPASSSSAATFAFGGQLGTVSAGQGLTFGGMPSPAANPFSSSTAVNLNSGFVFGSSSAAASTSAVLTVKSSGLPSLTATSSTFQFGAPASPLRIPFTSSGTANSSAAFGFPSSPSPVSSATPTFLFRAGAASSQSSGSASAGQPFTFNAAQPNPFTANPFASFGAPNSSPAFQFGPPTTAAAPSVFSSGSTGAPTAPPTTLFGSNVVPNSSNTFLFGSNAASNSSSSFAFGSAQPAASPAPFTFEGQTAALPDSGQLFGGGQPAMPAQSPFSAAGAAQASSDFAGGFALGATSGEKSGRKYIKPKRIGGAKRGK